MEDILETLKEAMHGKWSPWCKLIQGARSVGIGQRHSVVDQSESESYQFIANLKDETVEYDINVTWCLNSLFETVECGYVMTCHQCDMMSETVECGYVMTCHQCDMVFETVECGYVMTWRGVRVPWPATWPVLSPCLASIARVTQAGVAAGVFLRRGIMAAIDVSRGSGALGTRRQRRQLAPQTLGSTPTMTRCHRRHCLSPDLVSRGIDVSAGRE